MNAMTKQLLKGATIQVEMRHTRLGTPQPRMVVHVPKGTDHRQLAAALHMLAAEALTATATDEMWVVDIDVTSNERGVVFVELANGDDAEAKRAIELLSAVGEQDPTEAIRKWSWKTPG